MNGYILISRKIVESEIWSKPPLYLKVWVLLLCKAQFQDYKSLKRGQVKTSVKEIQEACAHYSGYRREVPTLRQIRTILEWLRNPHGCNNGCNCGSNDGSNMIETAGVTHGVVITICNFNDYQNPKFYGSNNGSNTDVTMGVATENLRNVEQCQDKENTDKNTKNTKTDISNTVSKDTVCSTDVQLKFKQVFDAWNSLNCFGIKGIQKINPGTKRHTWVSARLKEYGIENILAAIENIKNSDFLKGKNKNGWVITFDWFIKPNNFPKVLEGNYDNKEYGNNLKNKTAQMLQESYNMMDEWARVTEGED